MTDSDIFHNKVEKNILSLICATDDNYVMPLSVVVISALENLDPNYKIELFVIDNGISSTNKTKFLSSLKTSDCKITFLPNQISIPQDFKAPKLSPLQNYITVAAYSRLFMTDLLPNNLDQVIYLDCDLVIQGDLSKLWNEELEDNYIAAVRCMWDKSKNPRFNSGVMLINLEKWREENISTKALQFLEQHNYRYFDQEVLNFLFSDRWQKLDLRWNVQPRAALEYSSWEKSPFSQDEYHCFLSDPYIIHYITSSKPWNAPASRVPWGDVFFQYLDKTAWSGWRFTFQRRVKQRLARDLKKLSRSFSQ
jgi:lipopolysaccharide biosynthesis glycosyltransferase